MNKQNVHSFIYVYSERHYVTWAKEIKKRPCSKLLFCFLQLWLMNYPTVRKITVCELDQFGFTASGLSSISHRSSVFCSPVVSICDHADVRCMYVTLFGVSLFCNGLFNYWFCSVQCQCQLLVLFSSTSDV